MKVSALILYDREVSSKVLVLQRNTPGHHWWMFSHVVLAGLNRLDERNLRVG